ncbi:hypothetical protein KK120_18620 [Virgibacillus dakarensis]|nr:hypothetical protein [Virgibacillus dakarensis]
MSNSVTGFFQGIDNFGRNLIELEEHMKQAARKAAIENALHLLSEAMQQAPLYLGQIGPDGDLLKDEDGNIVSDHTGGKLRASGTVVHQEIPIAVGDENGSINVNTKLDTNTRIISQKIEVLVGFNTVYAMKQHEEVGYRHVEGKAKYLEDPLKENAEAFARNVQTELRKALEKYTNRQS